MTAPTEILNIAAHNVLNPANSTKAIQPPMIRITIKKNTIIVFVMILLFNNVIKF